MERAKVNIHGIVQGVGFRPFIHKLVREYRLSGFIKNTSSGVELELEGEREELSRFVADIPARAPKLALIERVETSYSPELKHFQGFEIRKSRTEELRNTLISPDIGICDDCRRELLDPAATKGNQVRYLKKMFGDCVTYCCGDYENDEDMLKKADFAVVPCSGMKKIVDIADIVTCHCAEGTIAYLIDLLDRQS